ncbi:cell division protein FtsQ/DivIB [Allokutzneria oryzae]|uniref:Cell division protein FtsQ/DivIB n=1 Tax=Allokutzneria oryzae TaxID=1378989 RepID=A0ABV6A585_9PSEU
MTSPTRGARADRTGEPSARDRSADRRRGGSSARGGRRPSSRGRGGRRPVRRVRSRVRPWMVLLAVLVLLALGYVGLFTSVLGVRSVEVSGTKTITADEVRTAAAIPDGHPILRLGTGEVAERVKALPVVASAEVDWSLPSTVTIAITERTPVAVFPAEDGTKLVDRTGSPYSTVPSAPPGLPLLKLARIAPDDPTTLAAVGVLTALPEKLRAEVQVISAESPGDIRLALSGDREVRWGGTAESPRKAEVLLALLTRQGSTYNVSAPDLPTVS